MTTGSHLTFTRTIQAPVAQVYQSFTNRDDICDWLCYDADIRPEVNGYFLFLWLDGTHAYGVFSELEENKKIVGSWQDGSDIGITKVKVILEDQGADTVVTVKHGGFADEKAAEPYKERWERYLDRLKALLETGESLRITERVIIGIYASPSNAEIAEQLGVPVPIGARVANLVSGYSAETAGLQRDDVIVEVNGTPFSDDFNLLTVAEGRRPGDKIEVGYYRGGEKYTATMELRGYPIPTIPHDFAELADQLEQTFTQLHTRLSNLFEGVSEEKTHAPGPNLLVSDYEGSIRDSVATLVLQTRFAREWLASYTYAQGPRRLTMRVTPEKIRALTTVCPPVPDLLTKLQQNWAETVALLRAFPPRLLERKHYLWWITFEIDPPQTAVNLAIDQIEAALQSVPA